VPKSHAGGKNKDLNNKNTKYFFQLEKYKTNGIKYLYLLRIHRILSVYDIFYPISVYAFVPTIKYHYFEC